MRTLVTGGCGFIGSHLVERLLSLGHEVIVVDNLSSGRLTNVAAFQEQSSFHFVNADITKIEQIASAFVKIDWVFHLAGLADIVPSIEQPDIYFQNNVVGTLNVLECARKTNARRLIYAASSSSYGIPDNYPTPETTPINPRYPYALTKYMGEELVLHWAQLYKLPALSLRLFNVYGPRSRTNGAYGAVFGVFLAQRLNGKPYTVIGDGFQTRDFTYVTDVADAFICAADSELSAEVFNVGSGKHHSINYLVSLLGGEKVHITKRPGEPDCTFADIRKIQALLHWSPEVSFEQGVERMLASIEHWRDAPLWDEDGIGQATKTWFKYLS